MNKLFIKDLPIRGKRVLMRVDFNVPLDNDHNVADATRIKAALPSIQYVLNQGGSLILMSHLGRPHNAIIPELSLAPVAKVLSALLNRPIQMTRDCMGTETADYAAHLKPGEVILLENLRFHRAEEHPEEDPEFAKNLASYGDLYVNDAFGTAHRKHSSTFTITQHFPNRAAAGYLLEKEIQFLGETLKNPKRPFFAILGGAKISTKFGVIQSLIHKVDTLLIGGAMAFIFLKVQGINTGNSPIEEEFLTAAEEIIEKCKREGVELLLPKDFAVAKSCSEDASVEYATSKEGIPDEHQGLDIGPETIAYFKEKLQKAQTVLWNGPLGVYEFKKFAQGTMEIARVIAALPAVTIAGGGDLIAALNNAGVSDTITHISTGGGATLEYIEHGTLPCIDALSNKK